MLRLFFRFRRSRAAGLFDDILHHRAEVLVAKFATNLAESVGQCRVAAHSELDFLALALGLVGKAIGRPLAESLNIACLLYTSPSPRA